MKRYSNAKLMIYVLTLAIGLLAVAVGRLPKVRAAAATNPPVCTADPVVLNGLDSGVGSLRQAVIDACPGSTITFSASMLPTVSLATGQVVIDKDLTIAGPGADAMTVRNIAGAGANNRIFNVNNGVTAAISGLTISDGFVTGAGGGIVNGSGNLTLANSTVAGNLALTDGGGIYNFGNLTVVNSLISQNGGSTLDGITARGGGIYSSQGTVTVTDSTVSFNNAGDGGGIFIQSGSVASSLGLTRSSIIGNIATRVAPPPSPGPAGDGGGIYNKGATTLTNSTVRGNLVGLCFGQSNSKCLPIFSSGIFRNGGSLTLINSTVADYIVPSPNGGGTFTTQNSFIAGSGTNFSTGGLPDGFINTPYSSTLVPDRGAFTYSLMGGTLPTGISLATNGSVVSVSGTTDQIGVFYFSVKRTDGTNTFVTDYSVRFYRAAMPPPGGCLSNPVVANRSDIGAGTLVQAVIDACPGSTITFSNAVIGKISSGLTIKKNLTIAGPGADVLTIRGAVSVNGGVTAAISGLTISPGSIGGISNQGNLTITNLNISRNSGGGIYNSGNLTVVGSTISENGYEYLPNLRPKVDGGGIYNDGTLTITGSTISGNFISSTSTSWGAGLYNNGAATITNSTVSGNRIRADEADGGGIFNFGTLSLVNSTVANNSMEVDSVGFGSGISNWSNVGVNIQNSIISGNTGSGRPGTTGQVLNLDFDGVLNSLGNNLIGGDARLGPLGFYGGPTQTHSLLPDSPAIDAGTNCVLTNNCASNNLGFNLTTDQRGFGRLAGGAVDIGAYEYASTVSVGPLVHFAIGNIGAQSSGTSFNITITAQDANNNTISSFTGPVNLSTTAGTITPTVTGAFTSGVRTESVSVTAPGPSQTISVDGGGGHTGISNSFSVNCTAITLSPSTLPGNTVGAAYNNALSASGGTVPYSFTITSGAAPAGLTLNTDGTWSGTTTTAGTFNFTVTVTGSGGGCSGVLAYTVVVGSAVSAGNVLISEFRFRGSAGLSDEFIELYNNTDTNIVVATTDASKGWALVAADGLTRFIVPNGTTIPARGHFLGVNSVGYSLSAYAAGDQILLPDGVTLASGYTTDIQDASGVALFKSATVLNVANRLDAAGYAGANSLYREGTGFATGGAETFSNLEYCFVRNLITGAPQDTDNNTADFISVDTAGTQTGLGRMLGTPGPENLSSAMNRTNWAIVTSGLVDPCTAQTSTPNRVRNTSSYTDSLSGTGTYSSGTLSIRRRYSNTTGGTAVTRLRFRIVDMTTYPAPNGVTADLRAISSGDVSVASTVCGGSNITIKGTTLEQPPALNMGGGVNSTLAAGTITLGTPLNPGQSINLQFLLGVRQLGTFRFFMIVEALP